MENQATRPETDLKNYERYLIHSRMGIIALLQELMDAHALVTVYFNAGSEFIVSSLLRINPDYEELVFDPSGSARTNARLLASPRLIFVAFHHGIKVQFTATNAEAIAWNKQPALRVRLPSEAMRLQRREYYRVKVPGSLHASCCIPGPLSGKEIELPLIDLSVGGIAVRHRTADGALPMDSILSRCRLLLPEMDPMITQLQVRYSLQLKESVTPFQRVGLRFVDLSGKEEKILQRMVTELDREQLTPE